MKKELCVLLSGVLVLSLCACGQTTEQPVDDTPTGTPQTAAADTKSGVGDTVDLTELDSTMLYAELTNILYYEPDSYLGKTIKMTGQFGVYETLDDSGSPIPGAPVIPVCVIMDATACCAQGLEFVCQDDKTYPDDYPERGAEITVTGEFQSYQNAEGITCYHLVDAVMQVD